MDRKTIEKAALICAGAGEYGELPYNPDAKKGFIAGAQWRINSVWHDTNELPKHSGYLAALMDNGLMETLHYTVGIGFYAMQLKGYKLWAYIEDLLPDIKEEEQ